MVCRRGRFTKKHGNATCTMFWSGICKNWLVEIRRRIKPWLGPFDFCGIRMKHRKTIDNFWGISWVSWLVQGQWTALISVWLEMEYVWPHFFCWQFVNVFARPKHGPPYSMILEDRFEEYAELQDSFFLHIVAYWRVYQKQEWTIPSLKCGHSYGKKKL